MILRTIIKFVVWLLYTLFVLGQQAQAYDPFETSLITDMGFTESALMLIFGVLSGLIADDMLHIPSNLMSYGRKKKKPMLIAIVLVLILLTLIRPIYFLLPVGTRLIMPFVYCGKYAAILLGTMAGIWLNRKFLW